MLYCYRISRAIKHGENDCDKCPFFGTWLFGRCVFAMEFNEKIVKELRKDLTNGGFDDTMDIRSKAGQC
jgi:hypothetical protein